MILRSIDVVAVSGYMLVATTSTSLCASGINSAKTRLTTIILIMDHDDPADDDDGDGHHHQHQHH